MADIDATPTRSVVLELKDERRAMHEGYVFLDEKCLLLAGEMLRELARYDELRRGVRRGAWDARRRAARRRSRATGSKACRSIRRGRCSADAQVRRTPRSLMGVRLQEAALAAAASPAPPAVDRSPEAEACRRAFAPAGRLAAPLPRSPATSSGCGTNTGARCAARGRCRTCCCRSSTAPSTRSRRGSRSSSRKTRSGCARARHVRADGVPRPGADPGPAESLGSDG